jgi:hypothetical protein
MLGTVNYLAVAVCAVASLILGFFWYAPLFGRAWMKEVGIKSEDIKAADAVKGYIFSLITSFVQALVLAVFINMMGAVGLIPGIYAGAAVGIGFIALTLFGNDIFEQRSFKLSMINAGYRIVYFIIIGAILGVWQ